MSSNDALVVTPSELKFRFELRKQIPTSLRLYNPTDQMIAFKVKTTSPKKYCVRPNTGIVSPGMTTEVTVIMQLQKETPPDILACKDKFLVQSVFAGEENLDQSAMHDKLQDLFNKDKNKESISETKLRVSYITPGPPPSPVPENAEGEAAAMEPDRFGASATAAVTSGGSNVSDVQAKLNSAIASLQIATNDKKAAESSRDMLLKEKEVLKKQCEVFKTAAQATTAPSKASMLSGFTLLHILLTAIIAFCLGRFT